MTFEERYADWPHEVSIETFAKCNAACVFCPYPTLERQGEKMPDAMLDRIIEELKGHPHPFILSPFKVNEPFLDKRLIPLCRRVEAELPNAIIRLFSNGSALTERHLREVASLKRIGHLWISLNSHDPDEYRATMSLDFDRTAANLDLLHEGIEEGWFPHTVVVSKVMGPNGRTARDDGFVEYANTRWPGFSVFLIKRDSWLGDIDGGDHPIPDAPCNRWWELNITATGVVALCCMDGTASYPVGDLKTQSLYEVYNSPAYRERRDKRLSRLAVEPCSGCNY